MRRKRLVGRGNFRKFSPVLYSYSAVRPLSGILKDYRINGERLLQKSKNRFLELSDYWRSSSGSFRDPSRLPELVQRAGDRNTAMSRQNCQSQ